MIIVPKPQSLKVNEGKLCVKSLKLVADNEEIKKFKSVDFSDNGEVSVCFTKDETLTLEQYKILIDNSGVKVSYNTLEGAFRAFTTLKQILKQNANGFVECLEIFDYPDIKNRGYMLDVSRGKLPNLEYLKELVDTLANLKYNQLQLYMDTFVYEYKNFPEYWKNTEPLSKKDIEELDAYCKERFILLVPNQNGFGHMASWLEKEELSHLAITGKDGKPSRTLNPLKEETLEFMDKIYDGYIDAFSANMINIGLDEPFELGLNETKEECEKYGVGKVYTDYLNKLCKLITDKYNKIPMFWDDIVFKHPEQLDNIPKNAVVMEWGYEGEQHFDRNCSRLKERGLKFYVCPGTSMWGSITGRSNNAAFNILSAAESGKYYGADGFLLTEWGDGGHPQFPSMAVFPLVYGGAVSWCAGSDNTEIAYDERLDTIELCKNYIDQNIFISKNGSLSDIAFRMGNYYLLEENLRFNGTQLNNVVRFPENVTDSKVKAFKNVNAYMKKLRSQIDEISALEMAKREIALNCDMVITFTDIIINGKSEETNKEINRIIKEFEYLWNLNNHNYGIQIFVDLLKSYLEV